jgi:hypothetical protein
MSETERLAAMHQVAAAWNEAWWNKVPHTQLGYGNCQAGSLKWYW